MVSSGVPITAFTAGQPHPGPALYQRILRAHANCAENLPVFAALVLAHSLARGVAPSVAPAATLILHARVAQSLAHWTSTSPTWVGIRFGFFALQVLAFVVIVMDVAPLL
jgi:uncharacterized MAPEG superfamily protein